MIGRLSREKIPDLLVAAAPHILERYPHMRFTIWGSGPEEETLKRFAKELGVSNRFEFMGWTNEVATILQTLDIFVFTSIYGSKFEGLPWAVLEAQAVGVPTIASAVGGVPEVIEDGRNGILLYSNDPEDLAEKVIWMIEHREHAADMGQAGRRLIESRFTIEREVGELQALYEELSNKG
jgi:glycosyltransferase involved in cell wall biosynthesis